MESVLVTTIENIPNFINEMKVNTYYQLPESYRYEWVKIEQNKNGYTWGISYNFSVTKMVGYSYPLVGNMVQMFKTLSGAKRSLLKRLNHINTQRALK